ncbi:MAG TPA: hypothetical protein VFZ08_15460 [Terriglobia bacterium]|nr:hypothetical protein [Terriglobia bacterium]
MQSSSQLRADAPLGAAQWDAANFDPDGFDGCPRCGNASFDRAPRNWVERGLGLAHMARCRACGKRFAYPQP